MQEIKYGVYENIDKSRFVHFANYELPEAIGANAPLVSKHATMDAAMEAAGLKYEPEASRAGSAP
jgi:hypothetical protein